MGRGPGQESVRNSYFVTDWNGLGTEPEKAQLPGYFPVLSISFLFIISKSFMNINLMQIATTLARYFYYLHSCNGETEAQC